jgi:AraC-like DNA-binding protein
MRGGTWGALPVQDRDMGRLRRVTSALDEVSRTRISDVARQATGQKLQSGAPLWDTFYYFVTHDNLSAVLMDNFYNSRLLAERIWPFLPPSAPARHSYFCPLHLFSAHAAAGYEAERVGGLDYYLLCLTTAGEGRLDYEGKTYTLRPGEGILIDGRKPSHFSTTARHGWNYHNIFFEGVTAEGYYSRIRRQNGGAFAFPQGGLMSTLVEKLYDVNRHAGSRAECLSSCIITEMLTEILCASPAGCPEEVPGKILEIQDYLEEHYPEPVDMDTLSRLFAMSRFHLSRTFRKYTGRSPGEYLGAVRLGHAKALLRATDLTVAAIASETGYPDSTYFYEVFKKHEGLSPGEYRKQAGERQDLPFFS